ncbi:hypothetical protein Tco_1388049 [Tanacetum coccineum]
MIVKMNTNFEKGFPIPYRRVVHGTSIFHENGVRRIIVADEAQMAAPRVSVLMDNETSNTLSAETENWQDLLAMYTGLLQEKTPDTNRMLEDINETPPPIVRNNRFQSLATSTRSSYQNHTSSQASTSFPY